MESSWSEKLPGGRKKAIQEHLIRGRELTKQLQVMLSSSKPLKAEEGSVFAEDLVMEIMGSFTDPLSILNSSRDSDDVTQNQADARVNSPCWDGRKSEDSGESISKTMPLKDRRGCYRRRKTSKTLTKITPTLIDDGHAWRKYGQKVILNAKHPRNYFRCTHKFDQGCPATKQVQRTEDDPSMYRTTYHGHHTCKNLLRAPQFILDPIASTANKDSSILLSFGSNNKPTLNHDHPFFPSLITQEYKEEDISSFNNHNNQSSSNSDYFLSPDHLTTLESAEPMNGLLSPRSSDHGDVISSGVYSCTTSTRSFEMDHMMVGCDDFADVLQFEF